MRAEGISASMPSRKPTPARRIGASVSFFAGDLWRLHRRDRRLDLDQLQRQVARHLVAEQHPDLVQDLAKALGRAVLLPHQGKLVLDQGVGDDVDAACAHATDLHGSAKWRQIGRTFSANREAAWPGRATAVRAPLLAS
ncbi:hypothetical protein ACVWYH_001412 [Bradyrhizobium sp. GM24.11]